MNTEDLNFITAGNGSLPPAHKKVGQETDSLGNVLDIWFSDMIANTPALPPFLRQYAEIIERGFATPYVTWGEFNKLHIVYALNDKGVVVGGIAFEYRPVAKEGWLVLSFTEQEFRGRGVNGLLHPYFEEVTARRGGIRIGSFVHINNISRQKSAEKVDFYPEYYRMAKFLDK
jgi:GNAT superfamily N-acetyltransferase